MTYEPTGSDRRQAIAEAIQTEPRGWLPLTDLADLLGLDRATVLYHAKRMVDAGTAAIGTLKQVDPLDSGRPPRVVIDPDRLADLERRPTIAHREDMGDGRTELIEKTYEITVESAPDEWAPSTPPRLGPVATALRDGAHGDALADAIGRTVANALLTELRAGTVRFVLEHSPTDAEPFATLTEVTTDDA